MRHALPRLSAARWGLALLLLMGAAQPAHACYWRLSDFFEPLPPCPVADNNTTHRVQEENARIMAKLVTVASHLQEVAAETVAWDGAMGTAVDYRDLLLRTYGDVSTNPLPSLSASYAQTPVAAYVAIGPDGSFHPVNIALGMRQSLDSLSRAFADSTNLQHLYAEERMPITRSALEVHQNAQRLNQQIVALATYRTATRPVLDSLQRMGGRLGTRYQNVSTGGAKAEADLSDLQATMARLRGTAFSTQAAAIQARVQALTAANATARRMADNQLTAPGFFRY